MTTSTVVARALTNALQALIPFDRRRGVRVRANHRLDVEQALVQSNLEHAGYSVPGLASDVTVRSTGAKLTDPHVANGLRNNLKGHAIAGVAGQELVAVVRCADESALDVKRIGASTPWASMSLSTHRLVPHAAAGGFRIVAAPVAVPRLHQTQSPSPLHPNRDIEPHRNASHARSPMVHHPPRHSTLI